MSRIFKCILNKVCKKIIKEPFSAFDVRDCLGPSKSFLSKHAIDPNNPDKIIYGNCYFIRVSRGRYKINPKYKICP
tara:strand:+ start:1696 stop:1923 length:228 start_codon:yes stop_codon:yes gene_type:complete